MRDIRESLILAAIGAIVGAIVVAAGLHLVKEFAEMILRINPWHAAAVGAILGAIALFSLSLWNSRRQRLR